MSSEENRRIVREFFETLSKKDIPRTLDFYAEDGTCWTAGSLPFSGTSDKKGISEVSNLLLNVFPEGLKFTIKDMIVEGDKVAVEAESNGKHVSGMHYNNQYHFKIVLRDGKIIQFKEYLDTLLAKEVLVDAAPTE
jgi:ketosteroid isomerase-like protein